MMNVLTLVPTPIGNTGDITLRALETLREADAIACEDTRKTGRLLENYGITGKKLIAYFDHNERTIAPKIIERLQAGENVAVVSNAGTPVISDPGYRLVQAALEAQQPISALPGPNACITALVLSGLPVAGFTFHGFPARKPGKLRNELGRELDSPHTQIYYEAPHRLYKFLVAALEVFGDRDAAICRELSKIYEEAVRGRLSELAEKYKDKEVKGEIVVVIEGKNKRKQC